MQPVQITRTTTWEEFELGSEQAAEVIKKIGIPSAIEKVREDLLKRFADKEGMTVEEAEALLKANSTATTTTTTPLTEEEKEAQAERVEEVAKAVRARQTAASGRPYFFVEDRIERVLQMILKMRTAGDAVANVLFTGPTGCGKTTLAQEIGFRVGVPVHIVNCPSVTSDEKWVGHKEFQDGQTTYVLSEMLRWISDDSEWKIVLFDELTRLHPTRHNILFPLLDNQQSIWVPELDLHVEVAKTIFWATANIGAGYTGTHRMDAALSGRFGYRMELGFPDKENEVKILTERTGIDEKAAGTLVDIATMTRKQAASGELDESVSTRNLLDTSILVAAGMPITEAADFTFIKFYSEEGGAGSQRVIVRQIVTGKAAGR